jgi:hypothetical protein
VCPAAIVEHLLSQQRAPLTRLDERPVMRGERVRAAHRGAVDQATAASPRSK